MEDKISYVSSENNPIRRFEPKIIIQARSILDFGYVSLLNRRLLAMRNLLLEKTRLREFGILLLIVMLPFSTSTVCAEESFSPRSLQVEIFADGAVSIEYSLDMETTHASVDVALFGTPSDDIIVLNHRNEPLDYELTEIGIKIYTLGNYRVHILYDTKDLTDEIGGGIWIFLINSPINVTILLPTQSSVIPNMSPIRIETLKDKTVLTMPPGDLELVYTWTVTETIPLEVTVQLVPKTVNLGDSVAVSAAVRDDAGNAIEGATVTLTIGDLEVVLLSDQGNGNYQGTIDTTNIKEGTYDIVAIAGKEGYESAQTTESLIVESEPAEIPSMLYGGVAAIVVVVIAAVLYKFKMRP